jgi:hypothetical protein
MANLQIGAQEALIQHDLQRAMTLTGIVYVLLSVVASEVAAQREGSTALMRARNPGASTVNPYLQVQITEAEKQELANRVLLQRATALGSSQFFQQGGSGSTSTTAPTIPLDPTQLTFPYDPSSMALALSMPGLGGFPPVLPPAVPPAQPQQTTAATTTTQPNNPPSQQPPPTVIIQNGPGTGRRQNSQEGRGGRNRQRQQQNVYYVEDDQQQVYQPQERGRRGKKNQRNHQWGYK